MPRQRPPFWLPLCGLVALGLVAVTAVPSPSAEEVTREQQIAELERQIAELTKKLEELKKGNGSPMAPTAEGSLPPEWTKALTWRCIGPASMGGRITAISVFEADPTTYWVATASGGLLKTINNGITFEHQFDREATVSIGDVCVAPSNKDIVWVGTGENNPRNSVSYGDGVYKSTDGGKTWKNMGLKKSFQTGRVVVHPRDPNVVYVGALGRLYGPSEERGLFKTADGGKTWQKVLYVDDKTGVIDIAMHPSDPETLLVATWERQRDLHDSHPGDQPMEDGYDGYDPIKKWGPGSGLFKTTDGGKTFRKLTAGLPTVPLGRIGLDYYRKDPNVVYAVIDSAKIGKGPGFFGAKGKDADGGLQVTEVVKGSSADKAGLKVNDVLKAVDKKEVKTQAQLDELLKGLEAGTKLAVQVQRDQETKDLAVTLEAKREGNTVLYLGALVEDGEAGVRVRFVTQDSPAAKAGLQQGDVITSIDKQEVKTNQRFLELVNTGHKAGDKLVFQVLRDNEKKELTATLEDRPAGPGQTGSVTRPFSFSYGGQRPNAQGQQGDNGYQYGGVYKSTDGGETWQRVNSLNPRPMYFSQVRVDPTDDKYVWVLGISMYRSNNGGVSFAEAGNRGLHPDQHALWIDPKDGRHLVVGCDGGFYVSYDRADHWEHLNHLAIGQFYHVAVDSRQPYRAYGGLQDNGSWGGPSRSLSDAGPINEDWFMVGGGDGFVCRVDPNDPDVVYWESQDGFINRRNLRTGVGGFIRPRQGQGQPRYRFNWNTPFILSGHNSKIFYSAGNFVFRSLKQGDDLKPISPEITRTKWGSATALAESPRNPEVLYVGTDDGFLWVTRDGGAKWVNVTDKVGLPGPRCVASVEPSRDKEGRCYVVFDGHRSDDDEPSVYVTEDYGETWKSLRANLPWGSTRVLREDVKNPDLLFLGTEFGAWASTNRGASWTKINNNLPTVAVHEFAIHPTAGEMVAATHGRSLWVLDVTPLRQMKPDVLKAGKPQLYEPNTAVRWRSEPQRGTIYGSGSKRFVGDNPPPGAMIYYSLPKKAEKVSMKVVDFAGKTVAELQAKSGAGLHAVNWPLRRGGGGPPGGRFPGGPSVPAGMYRVVLTVDGQELTQPLKVEADPTQAGLIAAPEEKEGDGDAKGGKIDD